MRRVLVTGASGQLGKCIQKIVKNYADLTFEFHNSETLDLTDSKMILAIFSNGNFDYCINCAAYTNVEQAEKTPGPAYEVNAEAVRKLAEKCLEYQVTLLHISTDYVFDGKKETGYFPDDKTNPINAYGKSKLKGEVYIQELLEHYFIVRTSWLYSEFGKNFYKTILKKAEAGEDLQITDEQTGCPTNANNLAAYVLDLVKHSATNYGIHHFTDGISMTWYGFAKQIVGNKQLNVKVAPKNYPSLVKRPKHVILRERR